MDYFVPHALCLRDHQMKRLLALLLALLTAYPAWATSVTVCDSGCDYATIVAALTAVGDGNHTITIQTPFTAPDTTITKGGTQAAPLIITGIPSARATIKRFVIGHDNVTIKNLHFAGLTGDPVGQIQTTVARNNLVIDNCTFSSLTHGVAPINMAHGTYASWGDNITVTNNTFSNIGYPVLIGGRNVLIENNVFDNNETSLGETSDVFRPWGDNVMIRRNEIKNVSVSAGHADFLQIYGVYTGAKNFTLDNNYFHDGAGQILQLSREAGDNSVNWVIKNNVFRNTRYRGNIGIDNVKIYNNVFDNVGWDAGYGPGGGVIQEFHVDGSSCRGLELINNISIGRPLWTPAGTDNSDLPAVCTGWVADYNMSAYDNGAAVPNQTTAHGINGGDPGFVDRAGGDYRLSASSIAIDNGFALPTLVDADRLAVDRPRGVTWDMGAYEYDSGAPPVDGTPPSVPAPTATPTGYTTATVLWAAATGDPAGYLIYQDNVFVSTQAGTGYVASGLTMGTSYSWTVKSYDAAGNVSAASTPAVATTLSYPVNRATIFRGRWQ